MFYIIKLFMSLISIIVRLVKSVRIRWNGLGL